jgi:hypothetical protein
MFISDGDESIPRVGNNLPVGIGPCFALKDLRLISLIFGDTCVLNAVRFVHTALIYRVRTKIISGGFLRGKPQPLLYFLSVFCLCNQLLPAVQPRLESTLDLLSTLWVSHNSFSRQQTLMACLMGYIGEMAKKGSHKLRRSGRACRAGCWM